MSSYYATGKFTKPIEVPELVGSRTWIEYNSILDMYRINGDHIPKYLLGYNPHKKALIQQAIAYGRRSKASRKS